MGNSLCDWTGLFNLRRNGLVKIVRKNHPYIGQRGIVVRMDSPTRRVWVQLQDGKVIRLSNRSLEVVGRK
jgi:hypothetical protein